MSSLEKTKKQQVFPITFFQQQYVGRNGWRNVRKVVQSYLNQTFLWSTESFFRFMVMLFFVSTDMIIIDEYHLLHFYLHLFVQRYRQNAILFMFVPEVSFKLFVLQKPFRDLSRKFYLLRF